MPKVLHELVGEETQVERVISKKREDGIQKFLIKKAIDISDLFQKKEGEIILLFLQNEVEGKKSIRVENFWVLKISEEIQFIANDQFNSEAIHSWADTIGTTSLKIIRIFEQFKPPGWSLT